MAEEAGPAQDLGRFESPYPDSQPIQQPPHNLFHGARPIDNSWLDEEGNEFRLPQVMTDDQNWSSGRARGFWRDVGAARSHRTPVEELWGITLDDDDNDSDSDGSDTTECEMPGLVASDSESNEFAPYASKTVRIPPLTNKVNS